MRKIFFAAAIVSLAAMPVATSAQSFGPENDGWGGRTMMGPGMIGRGGFGPMCGAGAAGFAEWPINRLERVIKPTQEQRAKFDEFKTASDKAANLMRQSCPRDYPSTAIGRMDAMEKRMEAMLQAVKTVRPALENFYASLSEEQKARLNSGNGRGRFWRWR